MLCQDCEKYSTCTELCEDAEEYVSQDHVSFKELPIPGAEYNGVDWPEDIEPFNFTRTENIIQTLQEKNLSKIQIAYVLGINTKTLRWHLFNIRKKLKK